MVRFAFAVVALCSVVVGCGKQSAPQRPTQAVNEPTKAELVQAFRALGADDPESWAGSQVREGIPQLARFLVVRQVWRGVVSEADTSWIDKRVRHYKAGPSDPLAAAGRSLERMRSKGVQDEDIVDLVRAMQYEALFDFLYSLDNPPDDVHGVPLASQTRWGLFEIDESGKPHGQGISGLYESFLSMDPTGREMRPR